MVPAQAVVLDDVTDGKMDLEQLEKAPSEIRQEARAGRPAHYVEIDPVAEKKLLRKIDLCLLPIATLVNLLSFIDRANIGNARVAGLDRTVGLVGYDFQYVQMVFYVMYLVVEVPSNFLLKKTGSIWLAFLTIGFGATCLATGFIENKAGLYVVRFFLGALEGGLLPGIIFLMSKFYRRHELVFRIGVFLALSPSLSGAIGGFLATGFLQSGDVGSVTDDWRKIFLWEGFITMVVGIFAIFFFPTWPEKTRMFNEEERRIALARVQNESENTAAEDAAEGWQSAVKGAFNVPSVVCITLFTFANSTVQGLAVFMPTVIRTLGRFTVIQVQLRTVPPYVVASIWAVALTYYGWKVQKKALLIWISMPLGLLGWIFFLAGDRTPELRYAACFLAFTGFVPLGPVVIAWAVNNVASNTSRGVVAGLVPGIGTIGSVIGQWCFTNNQAPNFRAGSAVNAAFSALFLLLSTGLWFYLRNENLKRDRGERDYLMEGKSAQEIKAMKHNSPLFRYAL